jgi:hypothetical protein
MDMRLVTWNFRSMYKESEERIDDEDSFYDEI